MWRIPHEPRAEFRPWSRPCPPTCMVGRLWRPRATPLLVGALTHATSRLGASRANVGAVVALSTAPSGIQRPGFGGGQTTPRCSARCFARHMRRSVSASTSAASSIRRSTSARRSSREALESAVSIGGDWSKRSPLRLPSRRQSSAFRDSSRLLSGSRTHATVEPSTVTGQREPASLSRRAGSKFSESHCERPRRTVRTSEPVLIRSPRAFAGGAACGAALVGPANCGADSFNSLDPARAAKKSPCSARRSASGQSKIGGATESRLRLVDGTNWALWGCLQARLGQTPRGG